MSFDPVASFTRRKFIAGSAAVAAVAFVRDVHAQAPSGPFKLDPLPYPNNALEPHIDARTMEIHHDKHHAAYVTNLNKAVEGTPFDNQPIDKLLREFKKAFSAAATGRFGSGWAWLSVDKNKKLVVESSANQDSPLMHGNTPILG